MPSWRGRDCGSGRRPGQEPQGWPGRLPPRGARRTGRARARARARVAVILGRPSRPGPSRLGREVCTRQSRGPVTGPGNRRPSCMLMAAILAQPSCGCRALPVRWSALAVLPTPRSSAARGRPRQREGLDRAVHPPARRVAGRRLEQQELVRGPVGARVDGQRRGRTGERVAGGEVVRAASPERRACARRRACRAPAAARATVRWARCRGRRSTRTPTSPAAPATATLRPGSASASGPPTPTHSTRRSKTPAPRRRNDSDGVSRATGASAAARSGTDPSGTDPKNETVTCQSSGGVQRTSGAPSGRRASWACAPESASARWSSAGAFGRSAANRLTRRPLRPLPDAGLAGAPGWRRRGTPSRRSRG